MNTAIAFTSAVVFLAASFIMVDAIQHELQRRAIAASFVALAAGIILGSAIG